jgi:hypothetical protein
MKRVVCDTCVCCLCAFVVRGACLWLVSLVRERYALQ